jgi:hypothetical protein
MLQKSLLLVSILLIAVNAFAFTDDPSSQSSENLINLTYYPHVGHLEFEPTLFTILHGSNNGSTVSSEGFELYASYGLPWDGLRFAASLTDRTRSSDTNGTTYVHSGVTDPNFSVEYRLLDMTSAGLSVDVEISFSPDFGTYYIANPGAAGSNHKGYNDLGISGAVYWTTGLNEFKLSGGIIHDFDGSGFESSFTDEGFTRASLWEGSAALIDRVHLTSRFFVEGEADFQIPYTLEFGDGSSDLHPFHVTPTLEVGYLHSKQLLLKGYLTYSSYTLATTSANGNQTPYLSFPSNYSTSAGMDVVIEF